MSLTPAARSWFCSSRYNRGICLRKAGRATAVPFHSCSRSRLADNTKQNTSPLKPSKPGPSMSELSSLLGAKAAAQYGPSATGLNYDNAAANPENQTPGFQDPYHLHVYATKHNTHITLTNPNRDALLSVSTGNIGFKKSGRGSYDAAYQLGAYVMNQIAEKGLLGENGELELVLRGFGIGRDAVCKILLGVEGKGVRDRVVQVSDATRLKFGGTRSKKPRRLG